MIYLVNLYNSAVYNNSSGEKSAEEWCSITSIIAAPLEHYRDIWILVHMLGHFPLHRWLTDDTVDIEDIQEDTVDIGNLTIHLTAITLHNVK